MNGFEDAMMLLRLVTDPETHKARLQELQAAIETAAARKAEADTAHAQLDAKLDVERDRLAKLEAKLRAREVELFVSECKHEDALDELRKWKRDRPSRLIQHMGGLTSEPDNTPVEPDPISDHYSEALDLAPIATHAGSHKAARVSMRRPRA
jgi:hypothetical protein